MVKKLFLRLILQQWWGQTSAFWSIKCPSVYLTTPTSSVYHPQTMIFHLSHHKGTIKDEMLFSFHSQALQLVGSAHFRYHCVLLTGFLTKSLGDFSNTSHFSSYEKNVDSIRGNFSNFYICNFLSFSTSVYKFRSQFRWNSLSIVQFNESWRNDSIVFDRLSRRCCDSCHSWW